ncbi:Sec-independent protein translocase protein TatB [Pseudomonas sp. EA_5y_Pfl2_R50]|uniref:Sec-independent protein translocase protein TatB n=1 Tax=Pseudomonas sp. EA_5y_Pfl2_R50 TaxID=3088691 RepID=UPI0030DAFEE2
MFGISFSELLLVGLVALLVLGPERLPGAARTAGLWVGRLKRSFNAIKQEVEREIGADEIRRQLHNEHILSLEQEARKIFTPVQQEPTPVEHVGEQTIHSPAAAQPPAAANAPVMTPTEPAPAAAQTSVEHVAPAAAPVAPAPHDPTLPPRAP